MENQGATPKSAAETTIHFKGHEMVLRLVDAQQIRTALQDYLNSSKQWLEKNMPPSLLEGLPLVVDDAWIDTRGKVRMGVWLLESRDEELVLTYRIVPNEGEVSYQYVAHLKHNGKEWAVSSITYVKLLPRRQAR